MSLGRRNAKAKHDTVGVQKQAGAAVTNFTPQQRVITVDGYMGTVTAIYDSPFGSEEYDVVLDGGMGGGCYTASQIGPAPTTHEAVGVHLASEDYPVLHDILLDRPDIATPKVAFNTFSPGQKVLTFDGLSGTITACLGDGMSSFGGGMNSVYAVILDNGLGGGEYSANDLRPQFGGVTPIIHQADMSNQMDGSYQDASDPGDEYHEEGGDLQTGASLHEGATPVVQQGGHGMDPDHNFYDEYHPETRGGMVYPSSTGGEYKGYVPDKDSSKEYKPRPIVSLNSLDSLMKDAQLAIDAAVNNSWGEPEPTDLQLAPKPFGATTRNDPNANPGSTGWASKGDPENWMGVTDGSMGDHSRYAKLQDELAFEATLADYGDDDEFFGFTASETPSDPYAASGVDDGGDTNGYELAGGTLRGDEKAHALHGEQPIPAPIPAPDLGGPGYPSGPKGGQGAEMPPGAPGDPKKEPKEEGAEATLHDEPEGALPKTDGAAWTLQASISMSEEEDPVPQDDQALTPSTTASLNEAEIVRQFQMNASYLAPGGSDGMSKTALKDYSPAEQQSIINEGAHASAGNLNRLQLEGTHYADLNEDEETWLS